MTENKETTVAEQIDEEFDKILDIADDVLEVRMIFIQQQLKDYSLKLRRSLDSTTPTKELIEVEEFKKWYIAAEVLKQTYAKSGTYNRLLYYMYEQSHKNIELLLSYYDLEFEKDEVTEEIKGITLVMIEE
tara:strand:+ start:1267 stop:1659 length:393 start_codon:yes stop_codon:yes gene_type:complete